MTRRQGEGGVEGDLVNAQAATAVGILLDLVEAAGEDPALLVERLVRDHEIRPNNHLERGGVTSRRPK